MNIFALIRVEPRPRRFLRSALAASLLAGMAFAQGITNAYKEPPHESGQGITAAYEGWYPNPDGSNTILIGYYNRNAKQVLDIPVGPSNRVDPGGPDHGQPTHFLTGRQWGVFSITVPKDFGTEKKYTWTIVANGKTTTVPFGLNPLYVIAPFKDASSNTPPFIAFQEAGPFLQGPPRAVANTLTASLADAVPLAVWVADDANIPPSFAAFAKMLPTVTLTWIKFRGPGEVKFANAKPKVDKAEFKTPAGATYTGKGATTATFTEPGEYLLEVTANDLSGNGGGGFQCCWTTVQVKVTVKP
ncbi:MAG: hypothetical protein LAP38_21025 [Acidobacteriia bacterium]|nr:hypothetical protein [Terriglobia bacterium]